jgi:phenylacetate-CoA ligase
MRELRHFREIAFADREAIKAVQQGGLREHLVYSSTHSPFYRETLKEVGIDCEQVTLDELTGLPFTGKSDLEAYNDAFCAVPPAEFVDIVFSSGTTGRRTRMMYTEHDLRRLAYNEEKSFAGCGLTAEDLVLLTCTMDRCFVAGLAYFLGIRSLGAAAIRNGQSSLESHADIISRMTPSVIVGVPTFLKGLGLFLQQRGVDPGKAGVSKLVCIGEPLRGGGLELLKIGRDLQRTWQAEVFSTYASSEIVTTFCECPAQQGGHLHPDLAIAEIVDEDGEVLPAGSTGELVVTPLAVEGMPLIRFKTGDVTFLMDEPCSCGRVSPRLGPILGRKEQMMKIRGTTLYPQAVYSVLEEMDAVNDYYVVVTSRSDLSDHMTIHAAVSDSSCTANVIQERLQARLRVRPEVAIADEEAVKQQIFSPESRKPVRLIDRR